MIRSRKVENHQILSSLTAGQKEIFFKTVAYLTSIDGHVDDEEVIYIKETAASLGFEQTDSLFAQATEAELLAALKNFAPRPVCLELVKELCLLAHADRDLSPAETLFIGHVGLTLGLDLNKIEQISNWVIDNIILDEQAKIIFEEF